MRNTNEAPPTFTSDLYTVTVSPGAGAGVGVAVVLAGDSDAGTFGQVFYHLVGDDDRGDFVINRTSGETYPLPHSLPSLTDEHSKYYKLKMYI